jgi:type IV pilus assembly protein PilW
VELMVALVLGLFVAMAASSMLLSSKVAYATVDDSARLQDTGRYAMDIIARTVNQTNYVNWEAEDAALIASATDSANINGLDARSLASSTPHIESPLQKSVNGSDVLAVRYFGSGTGDHGDGTILNCAGFGVPAIQATDSTEEGREWSVFYVSADKSGEPELRCKYRGKNSWSSEAIARGVESFQVLYGIDTDGDGIPNKFISADVVDKLDDQLILKGDNAVARVLDKNKKTNWKKIVAIKVALLVRGSQKTRSDGLSKHYDLFGSEYSNAGAADIGTAISEENIKEAERNRIRKVFQQTIILRNPIAVRNI